MGPTTPDLIREAQAQTKCAHVYYTQKNIAMAVKHICVFGGLHMEPAAAPTDQITYTAQLANCFCAR